MKKFFTCFWSMLLMLMLSSGLNATSITYSLTTHIDGRTITGTANVNSGASLENGMPQALWRANTTYKYYSDAALTQEITVAPATDATVYVDYVFEPPFFVSSEGVEYYYYFNAYIGGSKYYLCDDLGGLKSNAAAQYRAHAAWALYGDGYCLNLKAEQTGQWLTFSASAPVMADAPMSTGWQLYLSEYTKNGAVYETVILGTTTENQILHFDNNANAPSSPGIPSSQHSMGRFVLVNMSNWNGIRWDDHHKLVHYTTSYDQLFLSNSSFFFTKGTYQNIYSTVWRILKANGTWNPDIVVQKGTSATQIGMPTGQNKYTEKAYCTYDRYYMDAGFTEKYPDDYMIPVTGNTVIYVKERYKRAEDFQKDKWITLTIPYNIGVSGNGDNKDFETWFGAPDPVKVLELYDYELDGNKYNLKFRYTNKIEASKPYLFKPVNVPDLGQMCLAMNDQDPQESWIKETVLSGIEIGKGGADVTMRGTYEGVTLTYDADEIQNKVYAFLAYNKSGDMNFYRISEKRTSFDITPYRCYFFFTDPSGAGKLQILNLNLTEDGATAIAQVERDEEQSMSGTYDLMGRKVDAKNLHRGIYVINGRKVVK